MSRQIQTINQSTANTAQPSLVNHATDVSLNQINIQTGSTVAFNNNAGIGTDFDVATIINPEYYNLIVVDAEDFAKQVSPYSFAIPKQDSLTSKAGTDETIGKIFRPLSQDVIARIMTYPSICLSPNTNGMKAGTGQKAKIGMVTAIAIKNTAINIDFRPFMLICQQRLNDIAKDIDIKCTEYVTELNSIRWTIKQVNLVSKLGELGINITTQHPFSNIGGLK